MARAFPEVLCTVTLCRKYTRALTFENFPKGKSIKIPHLRVKKDWYKGLKPDPQDLEHSGLTEHEREQMEKQAQLPEDPFASGNLNPKP